MNELFHGLLADLGYPIERMIKEGKGFPPVSYSIEFKYPAVFGDVIHGELYLKKIGRSSLIINMSFRKDCGVLLASSEAVRVYADLRERRPLEIPAEIRSKLYEYVEG